MGTVARVELVAALADRGDAAALPAVLALLQGSQDAILRAAAIDAIGGLGSGQEVAVLKRSLAAADPEKAAATNTMPGDEGAWQTSMRSNRVPAGASGSVTAAHDVPPLVEICASANSLDVA